MIRDLLIRDLLVVGLVMGLGATSVMAAAGPREERLALSAKLVEQANAAQFRINKAAALKAAAGVLTSEEIPELARIVKEIEKEYFGNPRMSGSSLDLIAALGEVPNLQDPPNISLMEDKVRIALAIVALPASSYKEPEPGSIQPGMALPNKATLDGAALGMLMKTGSHLFFNVAPIRQHFVQNLGKPFLRLTYLQGCAHVLDFLKFTRKQAEHDALFGRMVEVVAAQSQQPTVTLDDYRAVTEGLGLLSERAANASDAAPLLALLDAIVKAHGSLPCAEKVWQGSATLHKTAYLAKEAIVTHWGTAPASPAIH